MEIQSQIRGAVSILTIANEQKRNAFGKGMSAELLNALNTADADPNIRVIVITGAGMVSFSSGHDLNEIQSGSYLATGLGEEPFLRPLSIKKPVIAAVNGHCYAAGFILALSCDIRVASQNATFGSPGARLGMLPEGGQLSRLPGLLPRSIAFELMATAAPLAAEDAYRLGFVSRLVPEGKALDAALEIATTIASNAPSVVTAIKVGLANSDPVDYQQALDYESATARHLEDQPDAREGVTAFFEKRKPVFENLTN